MIECSIDNMSRCIITKWVRPSVKSVKLNCDGCFKVNPSMSACGSIMRFYTWVMICILVDFYHVQTNMYTEAMALF